MSIGVIILIAACALFIFVAPIVGMKVSKNSKKTDK
jgi:hypothetical protein